MRTKIAVPMVALAVIPTATVGIFTISSTQRSLSESAIRRLTFDTDSKARRIREFLEALQEDLRFLSRLEEVRRLVAAQVAESSEHLGILRQKVTQKFLLFSQGKRAFYQVRYLDGAGREVVRLNVEDGVPKAVPSGRLPIKTEAAFVSHASIAISPREPERCWVLVIGYPRARVESRA